MQKEVYKLELAASWRIHNVFHVLWLEQDIIKKEQMNKFLLMPEFETNNNKEYEIETI